MDPMEATSAVRACASVVYTHNNASLLQCRAEVMMQRTYTPTLCNPAPHPTHRTSTLCTPPPPHTPTCISTDTFTGMMDDQPAGGALQQQQHTGGPTAHPGPPPPPPRGPMLGYPAAAAAAASYAALLGGPPSSDPRAQEQLNELLGAQNRAGLWEVLRQLREFLGPDKAGAHAYLADRPGLGKALLQAQILLGAYVRACMCE